MRQQPTPYRRESVWDFMREMDRAFDSVWNTPAKSSDSLPAFTPAVDLSETTDHFLVGIDLPGMSEKDIKIDVHDGRLTVSGERSYSNKVEEKSFRRFERTYGRFERTFQLPTEVDTDKIQAAYENGVLEILIPKKETVKPKSIQVETKKGGLFSRLIGEKSQEKSEH